ncbi:hypothetical protein CG740_19295 [Streptomyces sp. CB01201]|uniref:PfkB family carbohydrate kinase n=1 Tax=Streptomyces sp. CB01201 TaxID=2020324 RepID=UPI000C27D951|nr:PfkB family carbohydrate kinase [Streptomyces sp. CB01201]PJN01345.1 hypothetical protein CG740_19295 [Streptomyces sp. CB01201]
MGPAQCDSSPAKSKAVAGLAWLYPAHTDVAREWAATGPALVVLTLGAAGAHAYWRGGHVAVPGRRVAVVDTVGAGDAFMAGLLSGLMMRGLIAAGPGPARGERARQALQGATAGADPAPDLVSAFGLASRVAALTCMREGAAPPTPRRAESSIRHRIRSLACAMISVEKSREGVTVRLRGPSLRPAIRTSPRQREGCPHRSGATRHFAPSRPRADCVPLRDRSGGAGASSVFDARGHEGPPALVADRTVGGSRWRQDLDRRRC